jgi:hypothetical protein
VTTPKRGRRKQGLTSQGQDTYAFRTVAADQELAPCLGGHSLAVQVLGYLLKGHALLEHRHDLHAPSVVSPVTKDVREPNIPRGEMSPVEP